MGQYSTIIADAAERTQGLAAKLLVGVTAQTFARKPHLHKDGKPFVVDTNHPAFVYGHLSIYPARVLTMMKLDAAAHTMSDAYIELFKAGAPCLDDAEGRIYPKMDEIVANYTKGYAAVIAATRGVNDALLLEANPDEQRRQFFPTIGHAVVFMLNNHVMMHLGQVSAWRRCFGLASAM